MFTLPGCRRAALLVPALAMLLLAASPAGASEIIQIRTGQSGGYPGPCASLDDGFRWAVTPDCAMPFSFAPFAPSDFAAATSGPFASIVNRNPFWMALLPSDSLARWISWQPTRDCYGDPRTILYAYKFHVTSGCDPRAAMNACWAVDDVLGDPPAGGPNPIGVYINGVPLDPSFSGGDMHFATCAGQSDIPVNTGDNWLYIYQRDLGCGVSGIIFTATITITPRQCPDIAVLKFDDLNGDGIQESGEPGLSGWRINATGPAGLSDTTDANGQLLFRCVPPGNYQLTEVTRPGWIQTAPPGGIASLGVSCGVDYAVSFGNRICGLDVCNPLPTCLRAWFPFEEAGGITANEVMGNRDGTITGGSANPTWGGASPVSACSMRFPGLPGTQQVAVANCPEHNFGTGTFSIAAWFKTTNTDQGVHTIVDKRATPYSTPTGYAFFVKYERLGFQIGDGGGVPSTYLMSSGPYANDGAWHFGAVSVCRNPANPSSNVVTLVMDQYVDTFTSGIPTGSVTNTAGLVIGDQCPGFTDGVPFDGSLDEIQLYRCCLSSAQLTGLAQDLGYCRESCHVPSTIMSTQPSAPSMLKICNYSLTPQTYRWTLAGLPSGTGCTVAGPTFFAPFSGTVTVPAATSGPVCLNVPVNVFYPAGMVYPQSACYQATVQNLATGGCMSSHGRMVKASSFDALWDPDEIALPAGLETTVNFVLHNAGDAPLTLATSVVEDPGDDPVGATISLNGLPPGTPYPELESVVNPHDSLRVPVTVMLTEFEPLAIHEVVLEADLDGDGVPDPMTTMAVMSETADAATGVSELHPPSAPRGAPAAGALRLEASPNPFRLGTGIELNLPLAGAAATVDVYDVGGRLIRNLFAGPLEAGRHSFTWDGADASGKKSGAGIYFVRAASGPAVVMAKLVRLE